MLSRLRPGTHVLRRRDDRWQVGLDPARRVLLPATVRAGPEGPCAGLPAEELFDAALPAPGTCPDPVRDSLAAVAREAGRTTGAVLDRRARHVVRVETSGAATSGRLGDELLELCARAGLHLAAPHDRLQDPPPGPRPRAGRTTVVAVVCVGEPPRAALDRHVRGHVPHLLVRLLEGRALLGPFVVPGTTPCLRCLDAHLTDADPSWPLLVEQYARAVRVARDDGVPEPVDAALASLAIAWAVRDLATYAEGGTPTTLATTVELGPRLETVETRAWSPHHRCGCSWR